MLLRLIVIEKIIAVPAQQNIKEKMVIIQVGLNRVTVIPAKAGIQKGEMMKEVILSKDTLSYVSVKQSSSKTETLSLLFGEDNTFYLVLKKGATRKNIAKRLRVLAEQLEEN